MRYSLLGKVKQESIKGGRQKTREVSDQHPSPSELNNIIAITS